MDNLITLTGDYGYDQFRIAGLGSTEIDASAASWTLANMGEVLNRYPVLVTDSDGVVLRGGVVDGEVPQDTDWVDTYINSAAVFARDSDNVQFEDWTISNAWDGIRISGADDATFTVDDVWMQNIRDDAIENDRGLAGTISDCLFDGVFVGISLAEEGTSDQTGNVVTLDNVLIRMEEYVYKGQVTHQSIFKVEEVSPSLAIHDCVFAITNPDHAGQDRLEIAWDSVVEASGNVFLNLSDAPLPDDYPMPPDGFTVLQGAEARAYWDAARDDWIDAFEGGAPDIPNIPGPSPDIVDDMPEASDPTPVAASESKNFFAKLLDIFLSLFGGGDDEAAPAAAHPPAESFAAALPGLSALDLAQDQADPDEPDADEAGDWHLVL